MDDINQLDDLVELFKTNSYSTIKEYLANQIHQVRSINDTKCKKTLKKIFPIFLDYVVNIGLKEVNSFLHDFNTVLYDLAFIFPDLLNEFKRSQLALLQGYIDNNEYGDNRERIICFSVLVVYLTNGLKQTNQFLANYTHMMNTLLADSDVYDDEGEINIELLGFKCILLRCMQVLCSNIKSYNPFIINQITYLLPIIGDFEYKHQSIKANDLFTSPDNSVITQSYCTDLFLNIIDDLMSTLKEDLNFDILFKDIITKLHRSKLTSHPLFIKLSDFYKSQSHLITKKKDIQINFLTIKRRPIQSLEPELDDGKPKNMTRIIEKKLKKTKRQAIRNLKKEAIVLDSQRQVTLQKLSTKRKEEQKLSNQFVEQSKVDYKKLITSQDKKRFKLKRKAK
jgi:hypothetical protein